MQTRTPGQFVAVLDFGAQYGQLIARRVRDLHVYSEIFPCDIPAAELAEKGPSAVILSGGVRAESLLPSGERSLTAVHGPGALVGDVLMAARDRKSPVDVIASQNTAALFLPYRAVMTSCARACERHAILRENLLAEIAEKYWRLRRRAEYLARRSLRARLAAFLLDAAADAGGNTFSLGMRREDLAAYLGANRSALCRELSRLRAEGWIDCCRDSVRLIHTAALAESAAAENRSGEK